MKQKTLISILAVLGLLVVSGSIAFFVGRGSDAGSARVDSSSAVSSESIAADGNPSGGENYPGAMLGNTQRTWPDPLMEIFDDTPHMAPGTYSVDWVWQRPVWTPVNHDGDFPSSTSDGGWDQCKDPGAISLTGKTQQQYVNARYLIVNDESGPSRLERGVPRGYAHSPQGAIVAAMNLMGYADFNQGDEVGEEADKALWSTSAQYKKREERRKIEITDDIMRYERADMVPGQGFIKVLRCTEDIVVVETAYEYPEHASTSEPPFVVDRVAMAWRDGDWQPEVGGNAEDFFEMERTELDGFTEVTYS